MLTREILSNLKLIAFDFDGVFTANTVYVDEDGRESIRCWRSDGIGLSRLNCVNIHVFIISTETNKVVAKRAQKLKLQFRQGVEDKALEILAICKSLNIEPSQAMFVGNDINDIPAFKIVGYPVAVADAYPEIDPFVIFKTIKMGGYGAVREICDIVYYALKPEGKEG